MPNPWSTLTTLPNFESNPTLVTRPCAGACTGALAAAPISKPSCQAGFSVKGETRGPKPEVIHPLTGQIEGVAAQRDDFCSAARDSSCKLCSCLSASLASQAIP